MNDSEQPKPKRRWYQFGLRTLMVLVLVLACALGWFVWKREQARKQQRAVEAIRSSGSSVGYEESSWPEWLRNVLGDDFLLKVRRVGSYPGIKFNDETMKHLASLPRGRQTCSFLVN